MLKDVLVMRRYNNPKFNNCEVLTVEDNYEDMRRFIDGEYHRTACISIDVFIKDGDQWSPIVSSSRVIEVQFHY